MRVNWPVMKQQACQYQQHADNLFHSAQMAAEAREEGEERADSDAGQEERNAEAERVDPNSPAPSPGRFLHCGHREYGREDRADARRPTDREGEAEEEAAEWPGGDRRAVVAELLHSRKSNAEDAEEMRGPSRR